MRFIPETKFYIQKYHGLEDIEKRSRALEITLGSSTDTNVGHNYNKFKNICGLILGIYFLISFYQ